VRLSTVFIANLQAVLREPFPMPKEAGRVSDAPPLRRRWAAPAVIAATILLSVGIGYQNLVQLPQMRQALALANAEDSPPTYHLVETRSAGEPLIVPPGTRHISLLLIQTPGRSFRFYECILQDESGKTVRAFRVRGPGDQEEWQLRLAAAGLTTQSYVLKLRGSSSESAAAQEPAGEYHFKLEFR